MFVRAVADKADQHAAAADSPPEFCSDFVPTSRPKSDALYLVVLTPHTVQTPHLSTVIHVFSCRCHLAVQAVLWQQALFGWCKERKTTVRNHANPKGKAVGGLLKEALTRGLGGAPPHI